MQAIVTKYHGPSRVSARCEAGRITISWDYALNSFNNHAEAARQLCIKLGWTKKYYGALYGAALPGNHSGYAFVLIKDEGGNPDTFGGYAPDEICPHPPYDHKRTTNDCTLCHDARMAKLGVR